MWTICLLAECRPLQIQRQRDARRLPVFVYMHSARNCHGVEMRAYCNPCRLHAGIAVYSEQYQQSVLSSGGESVAWVGSLYGTLPLHTSGLTTRRNLLSVFGGELVGPYALQRHSVVPFHWMGIHME